MSREAIIDSSRLEEKAPDRGDVQHSMSSLGGGVYRKIAETRDWRNRRPKVECCIMFRNTGKCSYGNNCRFLHEYPEQRGNTPFLLFKTKLCYYWEKSRRCYLGEQCKFAHGEQELRRFGTREAPDSGISETADKVATVASSSRAEEKIAEKLPFEGRCKIKNWDVKRIGRIYGDWIDDEVPKAEDENELC